MASLLYIFRKIWPETHLSELWPESLPWAAEVRNSRNQEGDYMAPIMQNKPTNIMIQLHIGFKMAFMDRPKYLVCNSTSLWKFLICIPNFQPIKISGV